MGEVTVVMARELLFGAPSVFLAGPTPERGTVPSWRPEAIRQLEFHWSGDKPLTVFSPESRGGVRAKTYEEQVRWEMTARYRATVVMFWIPRDMASLPGMTSNVEFGYDVAAPGRRVVLGAPPDCPSPERNRYLVHVANVHAVPVRRTLAETAATAVELVKSSMD